jgi:hypothetical protein
MTACLLTLKILKFQSRPTDLASEAPASVVFDRFQVLQHSRELLADGRPVKPRRALFRRPDRADRGGGEVVGKDALMARVWPNRMFPAPSKVQPICTQI